MPPIRRSPVPHVIDGEDRELGGSSLYVDLIPSTCWGRAGRSLLSQYEWKRVREMVYERAGQACEVCGNTRDELAEQGYGRRLHAHERYVYVEAGRTRVQRLTRLICQCIACDEVTHLGRTSTLGPEYLDRARAQACRVNRWSKGDLDKHVAEAWHLWQERSQWEWTLDATLLKNAGSRFLGTPH